MHPAATVHIVEDDEGVRAALARLLRTSCYAVCTYASARAFLEAGTLEPGCVLLDLQLPDASGLAVQEQLAGRAVPLPVVFLTGRGDVPTSVQAMRAGAEDFLTKPVEPTELLGAIERALARGRTLQAASSRREVLRARYDTLSPTEREVMALVASGHLNKQIAYRFGRNLRTIKTHRAAVMRKMLADHVADLVRMAEELGLPIEPPDH
jgi:FixJ family two-component response regulator